MTIPNIGFARSSLEVRFYLALHRCPQCGSDDIGDPRTNWGLIATPSGKEFGGYFHITCPRCGQQRSIEFFETADFDRDHPWGEVGHETPSTIISAREFSVELERSLAGLYEDFTSATRDELEVQGTFTSMRPSAPTSC